MQLELSSMLKYHHTELYYWLNLLAELRFVKFSEPKDFNQRIKIKFLITF